MGDHGWTFEKSDDGIVSDEVNNAKILREVYLKCEPSYEGRITVPVLWDKNSNKIVNNESSEIIRMLNSEFNQWAKHPEIDLYPQSLHPQIDEVNDLIYPNINNGVYKCGFAKTQAAYVEAFHSLFDNLDIIENRLSKSRYLIGNTLTEADVRLFTTLIRFDAVYVGHFKCNKKQIKEYPNISGFLRELYQIPAIHSTVNFTHIKNHYYYSHAAINPMRIIPLGPELSYLDIPHDRRDH